MKRIFFVCVMLIGVLFANAQVAEKTFAELKNEGNAAVKANDFPKALDLYEQAIVKLGDSPITDTMMVYNMGLFAFKAKNYEKALKYFDQSFSMNRVKVNSLLSKSDVLKIMKNDDESLKAMEAAFAIAPKDAKVKGKLAGYYVKDASIAYAKGSAIINKANAEVTAGKLKASDAAYKTALESAAVEFKKAMPSIDKALSYDEANATAKQLKAACQQALK
jgi:tetratricopeptide (TPR) repeat protein